MYVGLEPRRFAFQLLTRSGRISYEDLRSRDASFVAALGEPETFRPIRIRGLELRDRLAVRAEALEAARDGLIGAAETAALARTGAALVLSELVAVSADGRVSPGSPGLWRDDQVAAWSRAIAAAKARGSAVALRLVHAGRRGAVRPRRDGVDRPLRADAWPLLAASVLAYTPRSATPRAMTSADLDRVRDDFAAAARRAISAGADVLELVFAQGYLVADFLSPLTNRREDEYGNDRSRYPLEVLDAVRSEWTGPLAVALTADDHAPGGTTVEDAIATARALDGRGCDIVHVHSGGTVADAEPAYGRRYLTALSDRIRNEGGVPTMVGGHVASLDDAHTILVAGRADLVVMDAGYYIARREA
jgi:anthraniloyl-CoA monooxygenase